MRSMRQPDQNYVNVSAVVEAPQNAVCTTTLHTIKQQQQHGISTNRDSILDCRLFNALNVSQIYWRLKGGERVPENTI